MRIVVAMSGGVDSSVAAALMAEAGHDVIGVSMQLYDVGDGRNDPGACCTPDALSDARRVAAAIGIPHYVVNVKRQFGESVVSNFVREYLSGRTPIPCTLCNSVLKFDVLLERARWLGADRVATGHYARLAYDDSRGRHLLMRGTDSKRDQSYFLFTLDQTQLAHALFPVGSLVKCDVRSYAREHRLPVADKPESREICFVPDGNYARFVERNAGSRTADGLITDACGHVLGRHDGIHRFTVGQRKGLGVSAATPLYVLEIQSVSNTVVVGTRSCLEKTALTAANVNWIACDPPASPLRVTAQIRYRHRDAPATVSPVDEHRATVVFDQPQSAITPGQAVVFYNGDIVIGGGWID